MVPQIITNKAGSAFFRASTIAERLNVDKKTVRKMAKQEGWRTRDRGNRIEYLIPATLIRVLRLTPTRNEKAAPSLGYGQLTDHARESFLLRSCAVLMARTAEESCDARTATVRLFRREFKHFKISVRSIERWEKRFNELGLAGLVEHKQGRCGRPKNLPAVKAGARSNARISGLGANGMPPLALQQKSKSQRKSK